MPAPRSSRPVSRLLGAAALALALTAAACEDDDPLIPKPDGGMDAPRDTSSETGTDTGASDAKADSSTDTLTPDTGVADASDAGDASSTDAPPPAPAVVFAAVRFNTDGTLDTGFGTAGIARVTLGAGANALANPALTGLGRDPTNNNLVLFGVKRHETRTDSERVVARLTANGQLDTMFGTNGFTTFGITNLNDNARAGVVLADGKIVSSGYTSQPSGVGTQSINRIVLARLLPTGALDASFGAGGIVNAAPFVPATNPDTTPWGAAEAYGVAVLKDGSYVTTGYGYVMPAAMGSTSVDMLAFRFGADGKRDATFGTGQGGTVLDLGIPGGNDRGRAIVALPDDRIVVAGVGTVSVTGTSSVEDAMLAVLTPTGALDTTFETKGYKLFDFTAVDEEFWGAAVSPNGMTVAAVGYRAGAVMQDDDATLVLQPVAAGGAAIVRNVALSETANDRFWSVTFDANNLAYGAGYIQEGTDTWMAVARFKADGMLDTTFGTGGIAKVNVAAAGNIESARGVVIQSDGKVVIAGPAEAP
jgi:uncharacterized delta-60 repeat protein